MRVAILGAFMTSFGRWPEKSHKDLVEEAVKGALADSNLEGESPDYVAFGSCAIRAWGQGTIPGQVCLTPLKKSGLVSSHVPVSNVEGGCATGLLALSDAAARVAAGQADLALAVGVDKLYRPDDLPSILNLFENAFDRLDPKEWETYYQSLAKNHGLPFEPQPQRLTLLDVCALQASLLAKDLGVTEEHMAQVAVKNRGHGRANPKAMLRRATNVEQVLADKRILGPLTRSMCAPMSDGAAAVVVASENYLDKLPVSIKERALNIEALTLLGGHYRGREEPSIATLAVERALRKAKVSITDIDCVELHDATAFSELALYVSLGLARAPEIPEFLECGAVLGGSCPVNLSGGLLSKGHPLAASGLAMVSECVTQLREEAGDRQVRDARRALVHNAGGFMGLDEALCGLAILGRWG